MYLAKFWGGGEGLAKFWIKVWSKVAAGTRVGFPILSFGHRSTDTTKKLLFGSSRAWIYEQVFQLRMRFGIFEIFFPVKEKEDNQLCFHLVFDSIS